MTEVSPAALGQQLRARRSEQNLSLRAVERASGVNSGYLSQLERGEIAKPTPSVLQKVANAYDVPFQIVMRWAGYVEDGLSPTAQRALSVLGDDFTDEELQALKAVLDVLRNRGAAAATAVHRSYLILEPAELTVIRRHATALLREVGELDTTGPVGLDAVIAHAELVRAGAIDLTLDERRGLRDRFGALADWALKQLQGVVHFGSKEVYVNPTLYPLKQNFVLAHEIGHWVLPDHQAVYTHLDDATRLRPDFNDLLERQANQFGIELLARGDRLRDHWDSSTPSSSLLTTLSEENAISLQAVARRVAEQSQRPVAIAIAHRSRAWGSLRSPKLFTSSKWNARLRWPAGSVEHGTIEGRVRSLGTNAPAPIACCDLSGSPVEVLTDGLDTAWARFLICWLPPSRRRFTRR